MLSFTSNFSSLSLKQLSEVKVRVFTLHLADLIIKVSFFLCCALVKNGADFGSRGVVNDFSRKITEVLDFLETR
jgi:hypothetical protein